MENIEKLKNALKAFEEELKEIEKKLKTELPMDEKLKAEFRRKELLESLANIEKYLKRLEFKEKVKKYENSSRNT